MQLRDVAGLLETGLKLKFRRFQNRVFVNSIPYSEILYTGACVPSLGHNMRFLYRFLCSLVRMTVR